MNEIELKKYWKELNPKPITCMESFLIGYRLAIKEIESKLNLDVKFCPKCKKEFKRGDTVVMINHTEFCDNCDVVLLRK